MPFELDPNYKDVPARIADFKAKHPEGCLRAADLDHPYRIETFGNQTYIVYVAAAFRSPEDPCPGIGTAWEPFPGKTPYTKDSELQNAETSAWGRAIVAVLASESKSVASAEDVRNRQADHAAVEQEAEEKARIDREAMGQGWTDAVERWNAYEKLIAATDALDPDERALVQAEVKKAKCHTLKALTPDDAKWWAELIAISSPREPETKQEPAA